jgi:hypothetical protein
MRERVDAESDRSIESRRSHDRQDDREPQRGESPARSRSGGNVATLQRRYGNRGVQRLVTDPDRVGTPEVSDPTDPAEREAERVAERVVCASPTTDRRPGRQVQTLGRVQGAGESAGQLQRLCSRCRRRHREGKSLDCSECQQELRRSTDPGERGRSREGLRTAAIPSIDTGRPLPDETRSYFETRMDRDFSDVRVHTGGQADEAARAVNARAFTLGHDVVFQRGAYDPESRDGKRLLAHELTHVVQQIGDGRPRVGTVQRDDEDGTAGENSGDAGGPPTEPGLDVDTVEGRSCACIAFVHHNEPNAREIANALTDHCAYNLAMAVPKHTERDYEFEGEEHDPNEFFPRGVIEECRTDPKACARDVADEEVPRLERIQKQFFLAIAECTEDFSLPLVALHTNHIWDTAEFLQKQQRGEINEEDLDPLKGMTIDKTEDDAGSTVEDLTTALEDLNIDASDLTTTEGWTNIFRWCAADALTKCHIGDPANPDDVVWVTTERDFERLSGELINVAYQSDPEEAEESSAEGDLSTMFLILEELYEEEYERAMQAESGRVTQIREEELPAHFAELEAIIQEIGSLWEIFQDTSDSAAIFEILSEIASSLAALLEGLLKIHLLGREHEERGEGLRYVNIETPRRTVEGTDRGSRPTRPAEVYPAVSATLSALGLYCCDEEGERAIMEALAED